MVWKTRRGGAYPGALSTLGGRGQSHATGAKYKGSKLFKRGKIRFLKWSIVSVVGLVWMIGAVEDASARRVIEVFLVQSEFIPQAEDLIGQLSVSVANTERLMITVSDIVKRATEASRLGEVQESVQFYQLSLETIDSIFTTAYPPLQKALDDWRAFLTPEILRPEAVKVLSTMPHEAILRRKIKEGSYPGVAGEAWRRAAALLRGKGEQAIIDLYKELDTRLRNVAKAYSEWVERLRELEPIVMQGELYEAVERATYRGKIPPYVVALEFSDAARQEFHLFYDAIIWIYVEAVKILTEDDTNARAG